MTALLAAIAAVSVAGAGLSLSIPLLALRLEQAGYSGGANGIGIAVAGASTIAFAPFVPRLAARAGMRRFVLGSLATAILSLALFAATADHLVAWWPLRGLYSCALTGLFVASEFAVNALAPPDRRGVWVGIYSTSLSLGFAAGPLLLRLAGTDGATPFLAGMVLFAVAGLPIVLAGHQLPTLSEKAGAPALAFVARAPGLMSAAFVFGAIETGAMGLLPVQALRNGLAAETGALLVAALALGNVIFQIPLGFLSDRIDRPALLLAVTTVAFAGALALAFLFGTATFLPLLVIWSGCTSGLYMVGLAELGARYRDHDLVSANAAFVLCYASGMVIGPPLVGGALDALPRTGLFLSLSLMAALTLMIQFARWLRRSALT